MREIRGDRFDRFAGVRVSGGHDVKDIIEGCELVIFAVKTGVLLEIAGDIKNGCLRGKRIISLAAGLCTDKIREALGFDGEIIRAMPNLAIAGGNGIIGCLKTDSGDVSAMLEKMGLCFFTDEAGLEKLTAFSACGLGFAAYMLDCYVGAGRALGLDEDMCVRIAARSFENAVEMGDFKQTACAVATKDGATEQGLRHFEENDLQGIISGAVSRAYNKIIGEQ